MWIVFLVLWLATEETIFLVFAGVILLFGDE